MPEQEWQDLGSGGGAAAPRESEWQPLEQASSPGPTSAAPKVSHADAATPTLSAGSVAGAVGKGLADLVGIPTTIPKTAGELGEDIVESPLMAPIIAPIQAGMTTYRTLTGAQQAIRQYRAAQTKTGKAQALVSQVPLVGQPASEIMSPAVAASENRPVTPDENLEAIRGTTTAVGMAVLPKIAGKVAAAIRPTPLSVDAAETSTAQLKLEQGKQAPGSTLGEQAPDPNRFGFTMEEKRGTEPVPALKAKPIPQAPSAPEWLPDKSSKEYGSALRGFVVGRQQVREAAINQLAEEVEKAVPDKTQQRALSLMRDYKGRTEELERVRDGSSADFDGLSPEELERARAHVKALDPEIEAALHPTPEMVRADAALDEVFKATLDEGQELGFLDSNVDPRRYITHLLTPQEGDVAQSAGAGRGSVGEGVTLSKSTPFAKGRAYDTVLQGIIKGASTKSGEADIGGALNAVDALKIYGRRHAMAAATAEFGDFMRQSEIGRTATPDTAPKGWVPADLKSTTKVFTKHVAIGPEVEGGEPRVVTQSLYVPPEVEKMIRPLMSPDPIGESKLFSSVAAFQAWIKSVDLGLSVFHYRALNLTALGSMGVDGVIKSHLLNLDDPYTKALERDMIMHNGTTTTLRGVADSFRAMRETAAPTRIDAIRKSTPFRQFDAASEKVSHATFDVFQRSAKIQDYARKVAAWSAEHPSATAAETAAAKRSITKYLNAAYGGLNWDTLGFPRWSRSILRMALLAPDWTISNFYSAKMAFEGGPGGSAARIFWARSAIAGMALSEVTSVALSGKPSKKPWLVYYGKDKYGKDIYQNVFFAGAPSDGINAIAAAVDFGPTVGLAHIVGNKLAPIPRTGTQEMANRNFVGQQIVPSRPKYPGQGLARSAGHIAGNLAPIPFGITNIVQMLTDEKKQYTPQEMIGTILAGSRPRHIREKE